MTSHLRHFPIPVFPLLTVPVSSHGIQKDDLLADIQILFYLQGFSITEVQKKQAMLNASKQHHTGKPKGESHLNIYMVGGWFYVYYVGIVSVKWH